MSELKLKQALFKLIELSKDAGHNGHDAVREAKELIRCRVQGCGNAGACNGHGSREHPCPLGDRFHESTVEFVRILPEPVRPDMHRDSQGHRLRILREEDEGNCRIFQEQVLPERVDNPNAARFKMQEYLTLTPDEQRWVRDTLAEMLGEVVDVPALYDEIAYLRARLRP